MGCSSAIRSSSATTYNGQFMLSHVSADLACKCWLCNEVWYSKCFSLRRTSIRVLFEFSTQNNAINSVPSLSSKEIGDQQIAKFWADTDVSNDSCADSKGQWFFLYWCHLVPFWERKNNIYSFKILQSCEQATIVILLDLLQSAVGWVNDINR